MIAFSEMSSQYGILVKVRLVTITDQIPYSICHLQIQEAEVQVQAW